MNPGFATVSSLHTESTAFCIGVTGAEFDQMELCGLMLGLLGVRDIKTLSAVLNWIDNY